MSQEENLLTTATANSLWNFSQDRPPRPNLKVIFHGLMNFCYNTRTKDCEVAFNRKSDSHKLQVEVRERGLARPIYSSMNIPENVRFELGVQAKSNDVRFFYQGSPDLFDRVKGHREDFRWLLDLESDDGYGRQLTKNREFFTAKLFLKHGAVYTRQRTNSTFMSVGYPHGFRPLSHMPKFIAADIQLEARDKLYLKMDSSYIVNPGDLDPAKQYEIYFRNDCIKRNGQKCDDSDFHLNFEAVEIPLPLQFALLTLFRGIDEPPPGLAIEDIYRPKSNDATPCMATGFGQSNGFPPES